VIRIVNGGVNMPAFGNALKPEELAEITTFLQSRKRPPPSEEKANTTAASSSSAPQ
jgi:ubiquinol-cytochrome c reductase cytochrome b subunit